MKATLAARGYNDLRFTHDTRGDCVFYHGL